VHVEHLFVENEKMSKSLGNVYCVPDVLARGFRASALRYLLLSSHYRKQLNFTWTGMEQAEESLGRIMDFLARLETDRGRGRGARGRADRGSRASGVHRRTRDDLNTSAALAAIFDLVRDVNAAIDAGELTAAMRRASGRWSDECDRVLGVVALRRAEDAQPPVPVDEIERLIEERRAARSGATSPRPTGSARIWPAGHPARGWPAGTRWKRK
jgi:cysteinyl-tRNA synthetase